MQQIALLSYLDAFKALGVIFLLLLLLPLPLLLLVKKGTASKSGAAKRHERSWAPPGSAVACAIRACGRR